MEKLKQGYKQTDIGLIPEDWVVFNVGYLGNFSKGSGISRAESQTGEIPSIRYGEIYTTHNDYIKDFHSFISVSVAKNARKLKTGDLLFTASGETKEEIGKCVAFIDNIEAYAGGDILIISPENRFNSLLLGFLLNAPYVVKQKANKGQGDAVVHITKDALSDIVIALPKETSEQAAIATAISDVDALIAAFDKKITKKQQIKQGAMQQLLIGKKRLAGFSGEWVETRLGSGLKFQTGNPFSSIFFNKDNFGVRLIKNRDLKSDDQVVFYSGLYTNDFIVNNGDVLIGMDGDFLPCIWEKGMALLNQRVGRILITSDWNAVFLYYYLYNPLKEKQEGTGATTVKHLSHKDIENMELPLPPTVVEQTAIAQVLTDMDKEISHLEADRSKYEQIKAGMMQQLLTGKIRLVEY